MSKYKGLFTFDVNNHRYLPVEQADGIIDCMNYHPEVEIPKEPLIKDEKVRKAVRAWAEANGEEDNIVFTRSCEYSDYMFCTNGGGDICFEQAIDLTTGSYTIAELCGEEE